MRPNRISLFQSAVGLLAVAALLAAAPALGQVRETFDVSAGGLLVVEAEGAKIEILPGSSREVVLDLERRGSSNDSIEDDYDLDFSQSGDTVTLIIERKHKGASAWRNWSWKEKGLEATITVPVQFDAQVKSAGGSVRLEELQGDVEIQSSGGSIGVGMVDGRLNLKSAGGSIKISEVTGDARIQSSGGSITVERAGASVNASTSGGSIRVEEIAGPLQASTSGGSVRANLTETPASDSELSTSGGSIEVRLASHVSIDIDARASGGSVSDSVGVDATTKSKNRLVGTVGGGGPRMVLRSSGGSVRLVGE